MSVARRGDTVGDAAQAAVVRGQGRRANTWPVLPLLFALALTACSGKSSTTLVSPGPTGATQASSTSGATTVGVSTQPTTKKTKSKKKKKNSIFPSEACPSAALRGVYHPARLDVIKEC